MSLRTPSKLTLSGGPVTWTNMPAALAYFNGSTGYQTVADLTDADSARICVNVTTAGAAGSTIILQYSTDNGTTWNTAFSVPCDSVGLKKTAWANVPAAAKGDVLIRLGGQGGNGTADPAFGLIVLEFVGTPSFEACGLLTQFVANLYGLINNMRDNAAGYVTQSNAAGADPATIAAVMTADAAQYTRRLGWLTTAFGNSPTTCTEALALMGLTVSQATAIRDTLQAIADHTTNATIATIADVQGEANYQIANVPTYARLW